MQSRLRNTSLVLIKLFSSMIKEFDGNGVTIFLTVAFCPIIDVI